MDCIRIGTFELNARERLLTVEGRAVELGARAFDLLLALVENHGRLVTKAALLERVWPKLVVDENNLPTQIAALRRVLGANAIRTVPGFGYRFELPVASDSEPGAPAIPSPALGEVRSPSKRNWPERLPPLIGRESDIDNVSLALSRADLVTLVGSAGVGKTRLAQEILIRQPPGSRAAWVALESIDNAAHVPSAIAIALGLSLPGSSEDFAGLCQALEDASVLLILDGVEHLMDSLATPLEQLIAQTRGLKVLLTSQAPLRIAGECVFRLPPLTVPDDDMPLDEAVGCAAVALFAQRAAASDHRFELSATSTPVVAAICRRLDGNPLALELAAARVPALGLTSLLNHLDDRFRLLKVTGRKNESRRGALHAAFEWSYSLLSPVEQRAFSRLGAFAGSFSLEAAARCITDDQIDTIDAIDIVGRLVDRSLVTALPSDEPRYMLLESARFFARERLSQSQELDAARGRMSTTMLQVLDEAYEQYWSLDEHLWLQRYGGDLDNVRAAIDWATANDRALGVALYGSAWPLFIETELFSEARARYEQTVRLIVDKLPRVRLGRFWEAVATYDSMRQWDRARYAAELAADMYADTGDVRARYYTLMLLALNWRDDNASAQAVFASASALADETWPSRLLAQGALTEGALLLSAGQLAEARTAFQRAVRLALSVSERQALTASMSMVELDLACGDIPAALQLGCPLSLSLRHSGRSATRVELLTIIFRAFLLAGRLDEARSTGAELFESASRLDPGKLYAALDAMGLLACLEHRYEAAARIACCAEGAYQTHGQARRRPTDHQIRCKVTEILDERLGSDWQATSAGSLLDESAACSLALAIS